MSVRSAAEALAALDGGAALIDVKEPANGAMGRASNEAIAEVTAAVRGRVPVSAALGEWAEAPPAPPPGLTFVKWGLAGAGRTPAWRDDLQPRLDGTAPQVVLVAYADWECATAPSLEDVVNLVCGRPGRVLLLDTHCKAPAPYRTSPPSLLDWITPAEVAALCGRCRAHGVRVALAGSLGVAEIETLRGGAPDWFAVRGAACDGGRGGTVSSSRVRRLVELIRRAPATLAS